MVITLHLYVFMDPNVTFALYIIKRLFFTTEVESVYYAVRTEPLYPPDTFLPYIVNKIVQVTDQNVKHNLTYVRNLNACGWMYACCQKCL